MKINNKEHSCGCETEYVKEKIIYFVKICNYHKKRGCEWLAIVDDVLSSTHNPTHPSTHNPTHPSTHNPTHPSTHKKEKK